MVESISTVGDHESKIHSEVTIGIPRSRQAVVYMTFAVGLATVKSTEFEFVTPLHTAEQLTFLLPASTQKKKTLVLVMGKSMVSDSHLSVRHPLRQKNWCNCGAHGPLVI